jgi:hypothetical protein
MLLSSSLYAMHFTFTSKTGNNMIVLIRSVINPTLNGVALKKGDEIGAFTPSGLCVGAETWKDSGNIAITIWEDDFITPVVDGIKTGEVIKYKIWDSVTEQEYPVVAVTYLSGDSIYKTDGIAILASLKATVSVLSNVSHQLMKYSRISIGPNPMRNTLSIHFELFQRNQTTIEIYSLKGVLMERIINEMKNPGVYNYIWNRNFQIPSGLYFLKLTVGSEINEKMIKIM